MLETQLLYGPSLEIITAFSESHSDFKQLLLALKHLRLTLVHDSNIAFLIKVVACEMLWKSRTATAASGCGGRTGSIRRNGTIRRRDGVWTRHWRNNFRSICRYYSCWCLSCGLVKRIERSVFYEGRL